MGSGQKEFHALSAPKTPLLRVALQATAHALKFGRSEILSSRFILGHEWGEDPMAAGIASGLCCVMKHHKHSQTQTQTPATAPRPTSATNLNPAEKAFVPSPDEVARRAYFSYENTGSLPGHEVQHWLTAEAELITERNQTRVHGFHHRPT